MNIRSWFRDHSLKLLAIRDTPEAIAGGVAIGIFFGFTPLFGVKTISAIFFAWLTRSNILAAVIAGALHDLLLPLMPVVYIWEYKLGYWLLADPHQWPAKLSKVHLGWHEWRNWRSFLTIGKPLLLGSVLCGIPMAILSFVITKAIVARHQKKKQAELLTD
ncbi:MAG TPA: DUF2062 domain-containing protein [Candidatus Paceibacterota bacterium]|nr:DUF2062 domain-containing protein [Candidatus Paceibacterota bacterium]